MSRSIEPRAFSVDWSMSAVETILDQVDAYTWPPAPKVPDGWAYGCDAGFLRDLCDYWTGDWDWRRAVTDLNRYPQFTARIEDFDIHFIHVVGEAGGKRPLLLSDR